MIETIKVSSRGQVVIPESMRDNLNIKEGTRLVVIEKKHDIEKGLYFLTQDGYLLPCPNEGKFPKYQCLLLKKEDCKETVINQCRSTEQLFSKIVYHLNKEDMLFNLFMLKDSLMPALKNTNECIIETIAADRPLQLRFEVKSNSGYDIANVVFIQMPIT